jgi:rhodanese-related sulfurtransferase
MSKRIYFLAASLIILSLAMSSPLLAQEPSGDFEVVRAKAAAWLASEAPPVIGADAVFENLNDGDPSNDPFILSVRSPEHFELGHVPGAINIPWTQVAKPESLAKLPTDRPIVDYCYTGHTGQVAMVALNLLDYPTTNMKFGMMGWTKNDEVLATARFDPATVPDYRVETELNEAAETYPFPVLETGATDGAEIIRTAIDNYLSSGKPPVISASALFENLNDGDESNDPVIVSVRSPEHYAIGHIPGAINIPWKEIAKPENLANLPPDKPIVVYCYTGHTGQIASTILNVLGYDTTNLKFGMMGWSKNPEVVATSIFDPATQADYRLEATLAEAPLTVPETGAETLNLTWLYLVLGGGFLSLGLFARRKKVLLPIRMPK